MRIILQVLFAGAATLGFSIIFNIHGKKLIPAALGGALGWLLFLIVMRLTGSKIISSLVASAIIGFYAEGAAKLFREPASLFILPAIIPLVPGSGMYYTMEESIHGEVMATLMLGMETVYIAGAIAAGIAVAASIRKIFFHFGSRPGRIRQ